METHNDVVHQMEKIRHIFQQALYISTDQETLDATKHINSIDPEFRAIAYEGIAMGFALKDFAVGTLHQWRAFMRNSNPSYVPHVHVGLGWAIAKQRIPSLSFIDPFDRLMLFRVVDGCGYYDGTFRHQNTIINKERSTAIESKNFSAYDQGVGRSIWYHSKGNSAQAASVINGFDKARHADLWRGIGIACSFVGGFDKQMLRDLMTQASVHHRQLVIGAAFTARARIQTNSVTNDAELACRIWGNLSANEAMVLTIETEPDPAIHENVYQTWVSKLEIELQLS